MLRGIDISKWQGLGSSELAKDFVIVKATEGVGYTDPMCDKHYQEAKKLGKLLGVYHFARPGYNDPIAEANWFVSQIEGYIGEAILVLDWEVEATWNVEWAKKWLDRVFEATGVRPMIYMSASVVNGNDWSSVVKGDYGLWIAGYPAKYNVPNPPEPNENDMPYKIGAWPFWAIWQYTSSKGALDRDIARMDAEAWKKYASKAGSNPTPSPAPIPPAPAKKSNEEIADEVIAGKWGNGEDRKNRLESAGYDYGAIQDIVNKKMGGGSKREIRVGDSVIVNGAGTASSDGRGPNTRAYSNQRMRVISIYNGRYGCNQYNQDGGITAWWSASQVRLA